MEFNMGEINIVPGYQCNMSCAHCLNDSGPSRTESNLGTEELKNIIQEIKHRTPPKMTFTGGEPTLYIQTINYLIAGHPAIDSCEVKITTNGKFATSLQSAIATLNKINHLSFVQMSYDFFHQKYVPFKNVENLAAAAARLNIKFQIITTVQNPMQIAEINDLTEGLKVRVVFQPSVKAGRALTTKSSFEYPKLQEDVLKKKCPNIGTITYIPQRGYTVCCSSLVFNSKSKDIVHGSISEHYESPFYNMVSKFSFGEIIEKKKVDFKNLSPSCSSVCNLCDQIFRGGEQHG